MYELLATGSNTVERWRKSLVIGKNYTLGRGRDLELRVAWDPHISREHAQLETHADHVKLQRLPSSSNEIFIDGRDITTARVRPGDVFVIGSTTFRLMAREADSVSPVSRPVTEVSFDRNELQKVRFRDADKRIEVLAHLPKVIRESRTDSDLHHRLINLILAGIEQAEAAAIVALDDAANVQIIHWDRRVETSGRFQPSSRLVRDAMDSRQKSVLHVWESADPDDSDYTVMPEFDWAFCTPVPEPSGESWGIYVAGKSVNLPENSKRRSSPELQLQSDVRFAELVTEMISSVQRKSQLERQQAEWRQFFAPPVLAALGDDPDTNLLDPRETDVTVMFCDLRGFSQQAESANDDLLGLLERVSNALGIMTSHILGFGGVTGDFQGDAALGFWGWPFATQDAALDACRAALAIRMEFAGIFGRTGHPLANFRVGIGLAHGRAVAGKIGTSEQVKVTVFGPVVNLASRLESMTKQLRVPILLDDSVANIVNAKMSQHEGRIRKLAKVLPYGMETPVMLSELLPPESDWPQFSTEHIAQYESGVECFIAGDWAKAYHFLHGMPESDRAQDFLIPMIAQHNRVAPTDWDGIVRLPTK